MRSVALELKTENYLWSSRARNTWTGNVGISLSQLISVIGGGVIRRSCRINFHSFSDCSFVGKRTGVSYPHAKLLRGLSFQVECRRPLYLKREVSCRANY